MTTNTTAIIIGSNLAGRVCARALSPLCERVILIDRDELPGDDGARAGVPQARHAHMILDRGRRELEHYFPGYERRMLERGARLVNPGMDYAVRGPVGWARRVTTDARMMAGSRDLTDATIRELSPPLANVELRARTEVKDLRLDGRRIAGVTVQSRETGASEQLPALLEQAGVKPPTETVIDSGMWYFTRWFQARPGHGQVESRWWSAAVVAPSLAGPGAMLVPIENDRWIVSIGSVGPTQPKVDESNFMAVLQGLSSPVIAETVSDALTPVWGFRGTSNRMRNFASWADPVAGLVAIGDAACALNPLHGHGVTCAVMSVRTLEAAITDDGIRSPTLATRYHKTHARWLRGPWGAATGFDLMFPTTEGKRPLAPKLMAPYMKLFAAGVREDPELHRHIIDVMQLNRPAGSLMEPPVVARVLALAVKRRFKGKPAATSPIAAYPPGAITA